MAGKEGHPRLSSQGSDAAASAGPSCSSPNQPVPPSARPRPPVSTLGWEIQSIIASSPNFRAINRVHYTSPNARVDAVIQEVETDGIPLIITGWNRHPMWPKSLFSIDWLRKNGDQNPTVRNIHNWSDHKIAMDDFIEKLRETPVYASADEQERLYGKDSECPAEWTEWLTQSGTIPDDFLLHGSNDFLRFLPDKAKVQTLMCYMGIGDTFTPFHKDLCASSGQNLMCFSEHSGSAFWFMTKSSAAPLVAAYFHQLGQEVDLESHVVTIEELAKAPFDIYIAEQQLGDLMLVPPRSCHQVVNKGGITIKTSWSRMSLNGLQTALWHELPIYHRVCRQEIYKVKSSIFHALRHFTGLVEGFPEDHENDSCAAPTERLKQLVCLFDDILANEFSVSRDSMPHISQSEMSHTDDLHCDFCGADIFQSFFECDSCLPSASRVSAGILPIGDGLVLCPLCYVEGRTCECEEMQPVQCRPFGALLKIRDRAVTAIQRTDNGYHNAYGYLSHQPLQLLSRQDANIFEAAYKLYQKRQIDTSVTRSCRAHQPHQVPIPAAIYCKTCHFSKCYTHLLESDSIHVAEAIMVSDLYDGDTNWHQHHRNTSQRYQEAQQSVIEDEEKGSRPNALHKLIYSAKTFTTYRAMALEVTKHGWYDRFVQTISIPIASSPAKALVGLPDEIHDNKLCGSRTLDDSPSSNLAISPSKRDNFQNSDHRSPTPPPIGSSTPRHINEVRLLDHPGLSTSPDPRSPMVDPMSPSPRPGTPQLLDSLIDASTQIQHDTLTPPQVSFSPLSPKQPAVAFLPSAVGMDDLENLSDLTDLPTDAGSPSRTSITGTVSDQCLLELSPSPLPAEAVSNMRLTTGSKLKSRVFLDFVEIPQPEWKRERVPSSVRHKRKRTDGLFLTNGAGSSDSDDPSSTAQEIFSESLSKRKRKMSQGPASRLLSSSRRTHISLSSQNRPPNNFLTNALNQTFQSNSNTTAAFHVSTTLPFGDAIPPVDTPIKPKYRDFGVQKNLNFSRLTPTIQPSEDLSGCIMRLEAENRHLQAQVERYKHECEVYREKLEGIRRYNFSAYHHLSSPSGPLSFASHTSSEFSVHPRWRMRSTTGESQLRATDPEQPDNSPTETLPLPTPSSPEGTSPSYRRRTPTAPRSFGMRTRGTGPYMQPQQHHRGRGPYDSTNGVRQRGRLHRPHSLDHGEKAALPNTAAASGAEISGVSLAMRVSCDKVPPSPPSTVSERIQPPTSPAIP